MDCNDALGEGMIFGCTFLRHNRGGGAALDIHNKLGLVLPFRSPS